MDTQDFVVGVDMTGIDPATGNDINNAIELAVPEKDATEPNGKGLVLVTTDTAANVPDVPDASTNVKWKRYQWIRRPFAGEAVKTCKAYAWNDDAPNDVTYLKWVFIGASVDVATSTANNALATAENAETIANAANDAANDATVAANNAAVVAGNAIVAANTAAADATTAQTAADAAQVSADSAAAKATAALNAANAKKDINLAINPGTALQKVRTNAGATAIEWYNEANCYAKITETQNKGTNAGANIDGKNLRVLNTTDQDTGALTTLAAGKVTVVNAGKYYVKAFATGYKVDSHQLLLVKDSDNSTLLTGTSVFINSQSNNIMSFLSGILTFAAGEVIRLDHYFNGGANGLGLGRAANVHPDAGGKEVFAGIELQLIS